MPVSRSRIWALYCSNALRSTCERSYSLLTGAMFTTAMRSPA